MAGCSKATVGPTSHQPNASQRGLSGSLTVFAAASLAAAFNDFKVGLERANPDLRITYSFSGSQILAAQIMGGAPADVVATADQITMQKLVQAGLVQTPKTFATNRLEIITLKGNPGHVRKLSDLARPGLKVVLADSSVPVGRYAREALSRSRVVAHPVSLELDVRAEVQKVASGEADAAIVYRTDALAAGSGVTGVVIPDSQNVTAYYQAALLKRSPNPKPARDFLSKLLDSPGQKALWAAGFGKA